jgi:hypothetical protein
METPRSTLPFNLLKLDFIASAVGPAFTTTRPRFRTSPIPLSSHFKTARDKPRKPYQTRLPAHLPSERLGVKTADAPNDLIVRLLGGQKSRSSSPSTLGL